ncbi:flagellar biosynthetic protein FlhG [Prevotella intermedia]|uniref:Flagellar biosynthetic protein FlhG n=1 Tax=Prevotella intermedia TaxID=28131 RepID=A0A0S3UKB0_PREIN|nr:flagellar biosynthetic protein FlhG [Prevotella intermedia]
MIGDMMCGQKYGVKRLRRWKKCFPNCFPIAILILCETPFTCFTCADTMPSLSKNHGVFKIAVFSHCFPEKKNQQLGFLLSC